MSKKSSYFEQSTINDVSDLFKEFLIKDDKGNLSIEGLFLLCVYSIALAQLICYQFLRILKNGKLKED